MKYYKYSLNMKVLNIFSICLFIPFYIIILLLGYSSYINFNCLILYFLWMFLHEFLHGIGFSLSPSIDHKKIVYGANLEKGIFYCMCKDLISKKNIMISQVLKIVYWYFQKLIILIFNHINIRSSIFLYFIKWISHFYFIYFIIILYAIYL